MSGEEDENAAELKIPDEFLKAKCLMNCEVSLILEHKHEQLQQMSEDPMNQMSHDHRRFMEPGKTSAENSSDRVCYVHCHFCNTILVVNVPCSSMFNIVTVRCGHCANLLSVNVGALLQSFHLQDFQKQHSSHFGGVKDIGSSSISKCNMFATFQAEHVQPKTTPIRPPEKRQRVPSAYNRFIKEEIQRIKASNPEISHREAFSTAAKNWAHFPHIHFGLKLETNNK